MSGKIFISYRRDDEQGFAARLYERLSEEFGAERLFFDMDSIPPGFDFVSYIGEQIALSDIVLVIIGRNWLDAPDVQGRRRLDNPEDVVRVEIESALAQDKHVIPLLVQGAAMPLSTQLPESLRPLARRNAFPATHVGFRNEVERLIEGLHLSRQHLQEKRGEPLPRSGQPADVRPETHPQAAVTAPGHVVPGPVPAAAEPASGRRGLLSKRRLLWWGSGLLGVILLLTPLALPPETNAPETDTPETNAPEIMAPPPALPEVAGPDFDVRPGVGLNITVRGPVTVQVECPDGDLVSVTNRFACGAYLHQHQGYLSVIWGNPPPAGDYLISIAAGPDAGTGSGMELVVWQPGGTERSFPYDIPRSEVQYRFPFKVPGS